MNMNTAKDYLPYVQAMVDGKIIQEYFDGIWSDKTDVSFTKSPEFYRVKPESVKLYVATWVDNAGNAICSPATSNRRELEYTHGHKHMLKIHELDVGEIRC